MRKGFVLALITLMAGGIAYGKVGDILKVIKTPGPCPKGLAWDGKNLWVSEETHARIMELMGKMISERRGKATQNDVVKRLLEHYEGAG